MSHEPTKPGDLRRDDGYGHGSFEREDLSASNILYFLLGLAVVTALCAFALSGLYNVLDHVARSGNPPVSPLITNVPTDTLHIPPGYPQTAFPSPRLEEDERDQLNGIRTDWDNQLYTYGYVDEKAGTVRIPIERAMDLLVQRGLPVRQRGGAEKADAKSATGPSEAGKIESGSKAGK